MNFAFKLPVIPRYGRYRVATFIVAYFAVFILLAVLGYYAGSRYVIEPANILSKHRVKSDMVYLSLPRMTISMGGQGEGGGGNTAPRLRLDIVLEVAGKDANIIAGYQPRIDEKITAFMLKVKPEDVARDTAPDWLRGELLRQINSVDMPAPVHDLFFEQFVLM